MRQGCYFIICLYSLIVTASYSYGQNEPKRPAVRVERPEISFNLVQASDGVIKIRMTNNGTARFRYYDSLVPTHGNAHFFPAFRLCERPIAECGEEAWVNPNIRISSLIMLPVDLSVLESGGSMTKTIGIESMLGMGGIYDPDPSAWLQIKFDIMLTPRFEKYIAYVSDWIPVEMLMRP